MNGERKEGSSNIQFKNSEDRFPVLEISILDAKDLIRRIDKVLEEFPTLKNIVEKLEKKTAKCLYELLLILRMVSL